MNRHRQYPRLCAKNASELFISTAFCDVKRFRRVPSQICKIKAFSGVSPFKSV
jgi:hypothetical protein